jgi:LPXTG-site transpeptidase (sortase) family protein
MKKEPTIYQLEKLINAFRMNGGTDAELSAVARGIVRDFYPEVKQRPLNEVFSKDYHPSIKEIKDFKEDPKSPGKEGLKYVWNKKWVKYPTVFILSFSLIFSALNLPLLIVKFTPTKAVEYTTVKELVRPEMDKSAALEPGEVIPSTPTVVVPKIGVTAPVVFSTSNQEAAIQDDLRKGVVHYFGTAKPGEIGNSFITGHSSNYWWEKGSYNYIFANLDKLAVGDQAKIYYNGNKYVYQVKEVKVVPPTDVSVLNQTSTPTMTLMTCTPPGTNWKRLIVSFDQIAPAFKEPVLQEKVIPTTPRIETKSLPSISGSLVDWVATLFKF